MSVSGKKTIYEKYGVTKEELTELMFNLDLTLSDIKLLVAKV